MVRWTNPSTGWPGARNGRLVSSPPPADNSPATEWTAVPVGLPAAADPAAQHLGWVAAIVGATVLANVFLSNLRDREGLAARFGAKRTRRNAGIVLLAGLAAALLGPAAVRPLAALPVTMGAALLGFRPTERYGALYVDGALLLGALLALAWPTA